MTQGYKCEGTLGQVLIYVVCFIILGCFFI